MILEEGQVIAGRYRLVGELGRGGMGVVFRATHLGLGVDIALKILMPDPSSSAESRRRFEREARIASTLRHPNAVPVTDFGTVDDVTYLTMPLLTGGNLRDRLRALRGTPPLAEALDLARQVVEVLCAAHAMQIVHRDIKPENIFLDDSEGRIRAMVVDFGLAVRTDDQDGRITRTGEVFGSPSYMSPEQARGQPPGPPTDMYSFGCVLYELLVGVPPFTGGGIHVITQHLFHIAPRVCTPLPHLPARLDRLVASLLQKNPPERPDAEFTRTELAAIALGADDRLRSGDGQRNLGRASRMVDMPSETQRTPSRAATLRVLVVGELPNTVAYAFAANNIAVARLPDTVAAEADVNLGIAETGVLGQLVLPGDLAGCDVVLALHCSVERVAELTAQGAVVVADADPRDVDRLSRLLRVGVTDVVHLPLDLEDLLKTMARAARKGKRRQRG